MIKSNYIRSSKITPRIKQTVISGEHITIGEDTFEKLSKKPYGKTILSRDHIQQVYNQDVQSAEL